MLTLRVRVPTNAQSFKLSTNFFSAEFPEYTCSQFNDFFVVLLDSTYAGMPDEPDRQEPRVLPADGHDEQGPGRREPRATATPACSPSASTARPAARAAWADRSAPAPAPRCSPAPASTIRAPARATPSSAQRRRHRLARHQRQRHPRRDHHAPHRDLGYQRLVVRLARGHSTASRGRPSWPTRERSSSSARRPAAAPWALAPARRGRAVSLQFTGPHGSNRASPGSGSEDSARFLDVPWSPHCEGVIFGAKELCMLAMRLVWVWVWVVVAAACGPDGERQCTAETTDLTSDPLNCGSCGNVCGDGFACIDSRCLQGLCQPGAVEDCYSGAEGTAGVGPCTGGQRTCGRAGMWGACEGEVVPVAENCGDAIDNNCNGDDRRGRRPRRGRLHDVRRAGGEPPTAATRRSAASRSSSTRGAFDAAGNMLRRRLRRHRRQHRPAVRPGHLVEHHRRDGLRAGDRHLPDRDRRPTRSGA